MMIGCHPVFNFCNYYQTQALKTIFGNGFLLISLRWQYKIMKMKHVIKISKKKKSQKQLKYKKRTGSTFQVFP